MFQKKEKLVRRDKRLLKKLQTRNIYKIISWLIYRTFNYNKHFFVSHKKTFAIISVTIRTIFWKKVWYIDDFIIHKKARWKWIWNKLFTKALDEIKAKDGEYVFLVSRNERKASHNMYKKFWFVLVSMWVGIFAYKKLKDKK